MESMGILIMKRFYSATTGGIYLEGLGDIPADAIEISDALFSQIMDDQAAGKVITPGDNGLPTTQAPDFTVDEQLAQIRARRDRLLADCDFTQLPDSPLTAPQRTAWAEYRAALRALPDTIATNPAAVIWPQQPT